MVIFAKGQADLRVVQSFTLDHHDMAGDAQRVFFPHEDVFSAIKPRDRLLIDDGRVELRAEVCDDHFVQCRVIAGTRISDRKGVRFSDAILPLI